MGKICGWKNAQSPCQHKSFPNSCETFPPFVHFDPLLKKRREVACGMDHAQHVYTVFCLSIQNDVILFREGAEPLKQVVVSTPYAG